MTSDDREYLIDLLDTYADRISAISIYNNGNNEMPINAHSLINFKNDLSEVFRGIARDLSDFNREI